MRVTTIAGVLAACGAVLALAPASQAKPGRDWARVQAVEAPRKVRVVLHDDKAPNGKRKLSGVFASATADGLTIGLRDGTMRTFQRDEVRRVSVKQPFLQRRKAWSLTALAASAAIVVHLLQSGASTLGGWWASGRYLPGMGLAAVPTWIISTFELSYKPIYAKPPN